MNTTYGKVVVKTINESIDTLEDASYMVEEDLLYVFNRDGSETYGFPLENVMAFGKYIPNEDQ